MSKQVLDNNNRVTLGANSVVEVTLTPYVTKEELQHNHTSLMELQSYQPPEFQFRQLLDVSSVRRVKSEAIMQGLESLGEIKNHKIAIFGASYALINIINMVLAPSRKLNKFRSVRMFRSRAEALAWLQQS